LWGKRLLNPALECFLEHLGMHEYD